MSSIGYHSEWIKFNLF